MGVNTRQHRRNLVIQPVGTTISTDAGGGYSREIQQAGRRSGSAVRCEILSAQMRVVAAAGTDAGTGADSRQGGTVAALSADVTCTGLEDSTPGVAEHTGPAAWVRESHRTHPPHPRPVACLLAPSVAAMPPPAAVPSYVPKLLPAAVTQALWGLIVSNSQSVSVCPSPLCHSCAVCWGST